eukprot:1160678-Pelagomonas_calceolata.AAC.3
MPLVFCYSCNEWQRWRQGSSLHRKRQPSGVRPSLRVHALASCLIKHHMPCSSMHVDSCFTLCHNPCSCMHATPPR